MGIVYDLPEVCGKLPGETCTNTGFWWYWRFTSPGHGGYTVGYALYEVDSNNCLVGEPLGTIQGWDPYEYWNHMPGLGSTEADRVAIIATWDGTYIPFAATDNNVGIAGGGPECAGVGVGPGTSRIYHKAGSQYCPPVLVEDALGPTNILMDAEFSCASTATQSTTWGEIKTLFR